MPSYTGFASAGTGCTRGERISMLRRVMSRFLSFCWNLWDAAALFRRSLMAVIRIPEENRTLTTKEEIVEHLAGIGIEYNTWAPSHPLEANASPEEILQ